MSEKQTWNYACEKGCSFVTLAHNPLLHQERVLCILCGQPCFEVEVEDGETIPEAQGAAQVERA